MPSTFHAFVLRSFVLLPAHELRGLPRWAPSLRNPGLWVHSWLVVPTKQKGKGLGFQATPPLRRMSSQGAVSLAIVGTTDLMMSERTPAVPSESFSRPKKGVFSFCLCSHGTRQGWALLAQRNPRGPNSQAPIMCPSCNPLFGSVHPMVSKAGQNLLRLKKYVLPGCCLAAQETSMWRIIP